METLVSPLVDIRGICTQQVVRSPGPRDPEPPPTTEDGAAARDCRTALRRGAARLRLQPDHLPHSALGLIECARPGDADLTLRPRARARGPHHLLWRSCRAEQSPLPVGGGGDWEGRTGERHCAGAVSARIPSSSPDLRQPGGPTALQPKG